MKTDTLVILGAAALGLYLVARMTKKAQTAQSINGNGTVPAAVAQSVYNSALPGQEGWGWSYFTDGTAIGPDGSYYSNGVKVWSPGQ